MIPDWVRELKQVVAIQPKPAFAPVFQVVTAREGSGVVLIKESPRSSFEPGETDLCSWWRRGRVGCSLFDNNGGSSLTWRTIDFETK